MKFTNMLGLVVTTAVISMALMGGSSAMAENTALCWEEEELACPQGSRYPIGTEVLAQLLHQTSNLHENLLNISGATLLGSNLTLEVTCFESHSNGKTSSLLTTDFEGTLSSFTLGHCYHKMSTKANPVPCSVEFPKLGSLLLLKTGPNLGEAAVSGILAVLVCGTVFKCAYEMQNLSAHATGSTATENPTLRFEHAELNVHTLVGEIGCPKVFFFDATYEIAKPVPLYITS